MSDRGTIECDRLCADIEAAADLVGVRCLRETTRAILKAYERFFTRSAVSFRTTTRPRDRRGLNVRYVELDTPVDPWPIAVAEGFLARSGHPIDELLPEIQRACPILGYGVDFGVTYGVEKIWPFFPQRPLPLGRVEAISSLPPAAHEFARRRSKYGLDRLSLFGLDYRSRSVNLYFMNRPGALSTGQIAAMITELGLTAPGDEILRHCAQAVPIYLTFTWDSPQVERICFGVVAPDVGAVPTYLHPLLARYTAGAPFAPRMSEASGRRSFIYSVTLSADEMFLKIENDYTGTMGALMRVY